MKRCVCRASLRTPVASGRSYNTLASKLGGLFFCINLHILFNLKENLSELLWKSCLRFLRTDIKFLFARTLKQANFKCKVVDYKRNHQSTDNETSAFTLYDLNSMPRVLCYTFSGYRILEMPALLFSISILRDYFWFRIPPNKP